jgi:hypothetical protein
MRRATFPLVIGLILIAATPATFGGWAVISVQDLPEYLEVGKPATLAFAIRQHGVELMPDRSPSVILGTERAGWFSRGNRTAAERGERAGLYEATITPADTGELLITIDADFHGARTTLLPVRVVAAGAAAEPLPLPERGRHLFVAKGCVTCHVKADDQAMVGRSLNGGVAPNLTGRRFDAEWLTAKLADPARNRVRFNDYVVMPNLGLAEKEIAALVRYLNERTEVATGSDR